MREERRRSVSRGRRERRSVKIRRNAGGNLETPGTWGWWSPRNPWSAAAGVRMASANRGVDPCHQKEKGMLKKCAFEECGNWFESTNARRLFCSERCRRQGQNATRRALRAELRDAREHLRPMEDPWARGPATPSESRRRVGQRSARRAARRCGIAERGATFQRSGARFGVAPGSGGRKVRDCASESLRKRAAHGLSERVREPSPERRFRKRGGGRRGCRLFPIRLRARSLAQRVLRKISFFLRRSPCDIRTSCR